jgi:uncharacterized RDD family membrane protein YckC
VARRKIPDPELPLFDLPLHPDAGPETAAADTAEETSARPAEPASQTRLFEAVNEAEPAVEPEPALPPPAPVAPLAGRLQAGVADLAVHVLMMAVAMTAAYRLGVRITWEYWPPFAVLGLVFSFLYWVIPLAFWGQTPGMAWVGHLARNHDDEPLTFYQTSLRWLGALVTLGLAGLPMLLALAGSSLSDRLSRSKTVVL